MSTAPGQNALTEAWMRTSAHLFEGVLNANRAALATFGLAPTEDSDEALAGADLADWEVELSASDRTELEVGDYVRFTKTLSRADVRSFAVASGDTNPLHLDEAFGERTRFGDRIAHGTLVSGLISAALARLPGLVIYLSQDMEFHNPVGIGDRVTADCEIVEDLGGGRYRLATTVETDDGRTAIDGEAVVLLDEAPEEGADVEATD